MMGEHEFTLQASHGLLGESGPITGYLEENVGMDNKSSLIFTVKKSYNNWPFLCLMMRRLVDDGDIADRIIYELRYENSGYHPDEAAARMADVCNMLGNGVPAEKLIPIIEQRHEYQVWSNIVANMLNEARYDVVVDSQAD